MELREGQQVEVGVKLRTKAGHDAAYEVGSVRWSSSDESVATVEPNPNGNELEAIVKGVDGSANGAVVIKFECDGDPDSDGERLIVGTLDVIVTQGEAFVAEIVAGTVSDVPAEAPANPTSPSEPTSTTETSGSSSGADANHPADAGSETPTPTGADTTGQPGSVASEPTAEPPPPVDPTLQAPEPDTAPVEG